MAATLLRPSLHTLYTLLFVGSRNTCMSFVYTGRLPLKRHNSERKILQIQLVLVLSGLKLAFKV